jgi:hypothetical protein
MVGFCEHGNESSGSIKEDNFLARCATVSFSRTVLFHAVALELTFKAYVNLQMTFELILRQDTRKVIAIKCRYF